MIYNNDCLNILKTLQSNSIDMILTDPPYGKFTDNKTKLIDSTKHLTWDKKLDWDSICKELYRVIKPQRAVCLFCQGQFNYFIYNKMKQHGFKEKHHWYWNKTNIPNFASLKYAPGKVIEDILVFYKPGKGKFSYFIPELKILQSKKMQVLFYNFKTKEQISSEFIFDNFFNNLNNFINDKDNINEIKLRNKTGNQLAPLAGLSLESLLKEIKIFNKKGSISNSSIQPSTNLTTIFTDKFFNNFEFNFENKKLYRIIQSKTGYPTSIIKIPNNEKGILYKKGDKHHPTQKPVKLLEFLLNHYTLEKDIVLDFTMGSGSTGVACKKLNRNFIGIELLTSWFEVAKERIQKE